MLGGARCQGTRPAGGPAEVSGSGERGMLGSASGGTTPAAGVAGIHQERIN